MKELITNLWVMQGQEFSYLLGEFLNYLFVVNVKYRDRREFVNIYSFTQPYFHLLEVLWNNGKPIALKPKEILDKTGSQSAYANHKKLSSYLAGVW